MVNISLDQLLLVWIGYDWSRLININLDGLNVKKILVNIGKDQLLLVKMLVELTDINQYLDQVILTNYWLILTNYWLRMTKTE